jgi:hypothetical protein
MVDLEGKCDHLATVKQWTKSAEYNRINLRHLVEYNPYGCYKVRMAGSSAWVECSSPPISGAEEWLFVNRKDVPIYYWNRNTNSVVLI